MYAIRSYYGINAILGQRPRAGIVLGEQLVAVEMKVADQRYAAIQALDEPFHAFHAFIQGFKHILLKLWIIHVSYNFV